VVATGFTLSDQLVLLGVLLGVLLETFVLLVIGSGADTDNGMAHLVTFIHSFWCDIVSQSIMPLGTASPAKLTAIVETRRSRRSSGTAKAARRAKCVGW
jgi:hypothetical protein